MSLRILNKKSSFTIVKRFREGMIDRDTLQAQPNGSKVDWDFPLWWA
jgi:hypothetical protein